MTRVHSARRRLAVVTVAAAAAMIVSGSPGRLGARPRPRHAADLGPNVVLIDPVHAGRPDRGDGERDRRPAGRRRDGHQPLERALRARHLRLARGAAADPGRLLHRDRGPRGLAVGRRRPRQDRDLQPVPRRRGEPELHRAQQLLAHAVQPDARDRRRRPGRVPRLGELLGRVAGGVGAPARRARGRQLLAHGLLHGRARSTRPAASSPTRGSAPCSTGRSSSG